MIDKTRNGFIRFILITTFSVLLLGLLSGAYLENVPVELVQPNGEIIHCFASGDEYFNYAHDENGFTIIVGDDGYYYYGITEGERVVPSAYRVNSVNPEVVGISPRALISERLYRQRRAVYEEPRDIAPGRAPHTGTMNNLVIYIKFADDTEFINSRAFFDSRFSNMEGQSVRDYFQEVSYGQLDIVSHHFPITDIGGNLSYTDTQPRRHFRPYHEVNNPDGYQTDTERRTREHSMLVRAIQAVRDEVPQDLVIDADNDGRVDNVSFIIRGNSGAWADLLWAHRWVLYTYNVHINGKRVYDYTFQPENQAGASTLSHEMFHTLGAPDLYRYTQSGFVPVGRWDLMASGFVHMGAWMKYKYADRNWIQYIPEINTSGDYILHPLTSPTNNSYFIRSPYSNRQFFVLEYRRREGRYEAGLPGTGLLIYRINTTASGNAQGPPDEVYIYRPNGTATVSGTINQANFSSQVERTEINDFNTNPVSFLANGNPGGLHIYNIGEAGDTITFSVTMIGDLTAPIHDRPADNAADIGLQPTFEWGYINVADYYSLQIATDSLFTDLIIDATNITDTEYTADEQLDIEQTYYWRVSSSDDEETSEWSKPWSFTVAHFSLLKHNLSGASYGGVVWADFNNDGFLDLVITGEDNTAIYKNQGDGTFINIDADLPPLKRSAAAVGDINNNGKLDLVLIGRSPDNVNKAYVCINGGDFLFGIMDGGLRGAFNGKIALGDYNNNGFLDILIIGDSNNGHSTSLYLNNQDNSFTYVEAPELPGIMFGDIAWADFNRNGRLDVLISGTSAQGAVTDIYFNNGDGTFTVGNAGFSRVAGSSVSIGDYNNNGFIDVLVSGSSVSGPSTSLYRNNGDGTFTIMNDELPGAALGETIWGDFNQNGLLDLLVTGSNRSVVIRNVDGHSFNSVVDGLQPVSFSSASWGDFDNDGDQDLAIIGSGGGGSVLRIYRNNFSTNTITVNTPPTTPANPSAAINQCSVTFSWEVSQDQETPSEGLTYNISIGTAPGKEDYIASMSDLSTGFRRIPTSGNVGRNTTIDLHQLPLGDYYWRVQAIDGAYTGSPFTEEQTFSITTVSAEDYTGTPLVTHLEANYPNPFNPETTISFTLKDNEAVTLEIYNILGQKITTLFKGDLQTGRHSFVWNASDDKKQSTGSGIYFYKLKTDNYQSVRKMLLLK